MPEQRLKELLKELRSELDGVEEIDSEMAESLQQLEGTIDDLLNPETDSADNTAMEDAIALEASFAAHYPVAAQLLREVVNTLNRIGI